MTVVRCLTLPLVWLAATAAIASEGEAPRIDLEMVDRPASLVAASVSELLGQEHRLGPDLLDAGRSRAALSLALHDAAPDGAAQALAHALGCWWAPELGDDIRYSAEGTLPATGRLTVETYTTRIRNHPHLEDRVRDLMAPWLDGDRGLVLHAPLGRWSATLDLPAHRELRRLLMRLERPEASIPPLLPHPAQPAAHRMLERPLEADDWGELVRELHRFGRVSVSARSGADFPQTPVRLRPAPLAELPLQLAAQGVPAAWFRGVLCCGEDAHDRLHPGLRRRWATIPVDHLVADAIGLNALAARLRRDVAPWWWRRPGAGILALDEHGMLLVAADDEALAAILAAIQRLDRRGEPPP